MKIFFTRNFLILAAFFISILTYGQNKSNPIHGLSNPFQTKKDSVFKNVITPKENNARMANKQIRILTKKGTFSQRFKKQNLTNQEITINLNQYFGLSEKHTFQQISERTDKLGFTHINYQQQYNGIPIDGCIVMTHIKDGVTISINGQVAEFTFIEIQNSLTNERAKELAKEHLKVTDLLNEYPVKLLIAKIITEKGFEYKLAYKVRIDASSPFTMCHVYVDAASGKILNKINLIAHADTPGTANTYYSGSQTITTDSYAGGYRLRDNGRKIETYDATNATFTFGVGFAGHTDVSNSSTTWTGIPYLATYTISNVSTNWWYTVFADETPDLYIKVKDGANQIVYSGQGSYISNTNPPLTLNNLNIQLTNPPYTVEVWDYDAAGGDDFGGSYSISTSVGTQNWSGNGNNGTYVINTINNPALDVHWGMEKTYDFYLNVFGRNSFDGSGSIIKNYLNPNPSIFLSTFGSSAGLPNNAFAAPPPYNVMVYGMGDGQYMAPLVSLDIEGHEYTHMVINYNGNGGLTYQGESGALNESFADIFGTAVEFYTLGGGANWTIGEEIMISEPYLRSMSNPNGGQQPDTYEGQYWTNSSDLNNDNGGVHTNSGIQNFWFYLLCQGGTGTNDLSNVYSVTGIGINQAQQIAYRNLTTYLTPNATYFDAYLGSLQAAEDLYGNSSTQYNAVRAAWYAVGIGNDPNNYCSGVTELIASSGTLSDGSGSANYNDNANCKWVIAPKGATQITLNFTSFDTEPNYDTVFVYNGPDDTHPILMTWWGNTLPATINSTGGALCVKFKSDINTTASGWSANYTSIGITPTCDGSTILSNPTGTFNDGSGSGNYGNNQLCYWLIAPPCATSVTLSFSQFNTELNYDGVLIYNGNNVNAPLLGIFSGNTLPGSVIATSGEMLVVFISDYSTTLQGFSASYTSTGSAYCSGTTTLNTSDYGNINDGSGGNNYCNNLNCNWLIQPPQATSITFNFIDFALEIPSSDGQTIYDAVEIYDGTNTSAPLLGRFSGENLPPSITSTGSSMFIHFYSDAAETKEGWSGYYTSTTTTYCSATTNLSATSGTFTDGSGVNQYGNNTTCSWLIQPTNASSITLSFTVFNTELDYDGVIVYDGLNNTSSVIGQFTGTSIPSPVTSSGGSMLIEFLSDPAVRANGWSANYTSTIATGMNGSIIKQNIKVFPNPANNQFTIQSDFNFPVKVEVTDVLGKQVLQTIYINNGANLVDIKGLNKGIYLLKIETEEGYYIERLVVN